MDRDRYIEYIQSILDDGTLESRALMDGEVANYIPELAQADPEMTSCAVILADGSLIQSGDHEQHIVTLQSVAKLIVLIGLMEEFGREKIFSWINAEPTGYHFSSLSQVERYGPVPANPMVNAGAIALCSHIPGNMQQRAQWLDMWTEKLFNQSLQINGKVYTSERTTGDRNRSIAYLLRSQGVLALPVDECLETYFYLCSYESSVSTAAYLPMVLANGGLAPDGTRIISETTSNNVVSIMATCGLYDESGMRLVETGMPSKSGVSGLIIAVATGRGGVAVSSPRLNSKGGSVRGHSILQKVSYELDWHFAAPWGYMRLTDQNTSED